MTKNPEFKQLLTIRAIRRQRYFKKLYEQKNQWAQMRFKAALLGIKGKEFTKSNLDINPVRLTEENMAYENLIMYRNYSDCEQTAKQKKKDKNWLQYKRDLLLVKRL